MENRAINIAVVAEVAEALQDLKEHIVFVGGAVVSLYADDSAVDEIRPTLDVDLTMNIINLRHWQEVQEKLATLGFYPDPYGHAICSFKYKDIPIDIMAIEDSPFGPAIRWYRIGFENLWTVKARNQEIKILSPPCFLATKFEAFNSRGTDYRTSHDIEDIVYVIDNRIQIVEEIARDDIRIATFIKQQLRKIDQMGLLQEFLVAHIHPLMQEERMPIMQEKLVQILNQ